MFKENKKNIPFVIVVFFDFENVGLLLSLDTLDSNSSGF